MKPTDSDDIDFTPHWEEHQSLQGYECVSVEEQYEAIKKRIAALRPGEEIIRLIDRSFTDGAGI